jgi:hypothetical protein
MNGPPRIKARLRQPSRQWAGPPAVAGTGFVIAEAAALANHLSPVVGVIAGLVAGAFTAGLLAALLTLIAWAIDRNAGRQPSQGPPPGALDNAAQQPAPDHPAGQPRQSSRRLRPGAEAARSGLPRSSLAGLRSPQRLPSLTTLALFIAHSPCDPADNALPRIFYFISSQFLP